MAGPAAGPRPEGPRPARPTSPVGAQRRAASALAGAARALEAAGVDSPRADAEQLASSAFGVPRSLLAGLGPVEPAGLAELRRLVAARASRVPLQHLLGRAGFRYLDLLVGPGAFVPRPETEVVVEWALQALRELAGAGADHPVVVDLCAGPGTIALSVAHECPGARVYALEREPAALGWAVRNAAERVAVGDHAVVLRGGDVAAALALLPEAAGATDLVVSNPPYLTRRERAGLAPEVAEHDPPAALDGGEDGLAVIRPVLAAAAGLLRPGGCLVLEHSASQGAAVGDLLLAAGCWSHVVGRRDLAGRPRLVTARRETR